MNRDGGTSFSLDKENNLINSIVYYKKRRNNSLEMTLLKKIYRLEEAK